jgi:hypothetical protein
MDWYVGETLPATSGGYSVFKVWNATQVVAESFLQAPPYEPGTEVRVEHASGRFRRGIIRGVRQTKNEALAGVKLLESGCREIRYQRAFVSTKTWDVQTSRILNSTPQQLKNSYGGVIRRFVPNLEEERQRTLGTRVQYFHPDGAKGKRLAAFHRIASCYFPVKQDGIIFPPKGEEAAIEVLEAELLSLKSRIRKRKEKLEGRKVCRSAKRKRFEDDWDAKQKAQAKVQRVESLEDCVETLEILLPHHPEEVSLEEIVSLSHHQEEEQSLLLVEAQVSLPQHPEEGSDEEILMVDDRLQVTRKSLTQVCGYLGWSAPKLAALLVRLHPQLSSEPNWDLFHFGNTEKLGMKKFPLDLRKRVIDFILCLQPKFPLLKLNTCGALQQGIRNVVRTAKSRVNYQNRKVPTKTQQQTKITNDIEELGGYFVYL